MRLPRWIHDHYALVYVLWLVLCAVAGLGLRHASDPSVPVGRIDGAEASRRAIEELQRIDAGKFRDMEVVSSALIDADETAVRRWIILCDLRPRTGLREAIVVELASADGRLLTVRNPVR